MPARRARRAEISNAAPAQPLPVKLTELLDVLIVNEGELAVLARGQGSIAQQLRRLPVPCVIVTLGAHGCLAFSDGMPVYQMAFVVTAVDTTCAGDTFCGVVTAALNQQSALEDALRMASAAAALACTKMGAQASIPYRSEVDAFLAQQGPVDSSWHSELRALRGFAD